VLESDNIIVVEVTKDGSYVCIGEFLQEPETVILFDNFDKITKLKGKLFHFGSGTKVAHNTGLKSVDVLRDSRIRISILLRITIVLKRTFTPHKVKFFLARNHDPDPSNAILSDIFDTDVISTDPYSSTQLLTLTGDIDIKSTDDLIVFLILPLGCDYTIHCGSKFTMCEI